MQRKTIHVETEVHSCAVCGRRLLQGERPEQYLVGGARRTVCELCTVRANHQGWIRENAGSQLGARGPGRDERRSRLQRLRARRERSVTTRSGAPPPLEGDESPAGPAPDPFATDREPRQVHAVPTSAELKVSRAVELFNGSEHPRTVAGVARSLGAPGVAVRAELHEPSVVSIAVFWELCWYRYEVDLAQDGQHGVRLAEQGLELSELSDDDQAPNATADERGFLALADQ